MNVCSFLVGKPEVKRPLGRPRRRWVDNIKMERQDGAVWTALIWLRLGMWRALVNTVMNLRAE
jgi:hypothetical protein